MPAQLDIELLADRAAELPPAVRSSFLDRECRDPNVRSKVEELLEYADHAESWFDQAIQGVAVSLRGTREPAPGDTVGHYRIVSLIGRGGMGNVFLAERADGEIEQRVAIKFLRADGHRAEWRDRFLRERQMLASLQHPSIVRVIDAGHTTEGRPFLVMEHVEGVPIDRYAADIAVRDRLKLFLRVCDGVSHAHRHLIIHRDLKPSNILVDDSGAPKVLDFGIAKLTSDTGDVTKPMDQLLTPNYASPEQLRGEAQSTATDVYSLGAVLYKLVTGDVPRAPFHPPSRLNPESPKDLDFIIRKALRPEMEERYASVDEFAADVRNVLEHRPVRARGGDVWYRVRKTARRHWAPIAGAAFVLASLSAGLLIANRERAIAERRFADVRQLANKLFDIDAQVAQLQGSSKTRRLIVDTALQYMKRITVDVRVEPDLGLELATAYMRVGRVQGVSISPNLGQTKQAAETERKAQALIDSVLAAQPQNRTALLRAAQIAHDRMILAGDAGDGDAALAFAAKCVDRVNQYLAFGPLGPSTDHQEAQQVIIALINVANRYVKADRFDEAIATAQRAIDIALQTNWPTQAGAARMVGAMAQRSKGNLNEALQSIQEGVRLLEPGPDDKSTGRLQTFGLALTREAQILGEDESVSLNRPDEAVQCLERALKLALSFAEHDPGDFQALQRVVLTETKLAAIVRHKAPERAVGLYDDALQRLSGATAHGETPRTQIQTLAASVYPLLKLGRRAEARARLEKAFEYLTEAKQYPSDKIQVGSAASDALRAMAFYQAETGDVPGAVARCRELVAALARGDARPDASLEQAVKMSNVYSMAERIYRRAGEVDAAAELHAHRGEIWRRWDARSPGNRFFQTQLAAVLQ